MAVVGSATLAERLAEVVGRDHVEVSPPLSVAGVAPALAVWPASAEECAAVLHMAGGMGATVAPWGGGSRQRIGSPPEALDLVLHTRRLRQVVEWEPADLTACIQAGTTLAEVQATLATRGQQLAVDAPAADRATIGGLIATNTSGPRRWRYGGWRDLVIGMHMTLADGSVIKSGGRVVKNVQGYDLAKLFTGALGTLGVIVQANVRLVPLAPARRLCVARGTLEDALAFLQEVAESTLRVSTLDLLDELAARACSLDGAGFAALVLNEDAGAVVEAQSRWLLRLAAEHDLRADFLDGDALGAVWAAWTDLGAVDDLGEVEAFLSVNSLPAEVGDVMQALRRAGDEHRVVLRRWARAGNGVTFARLSASGREPAATLTAVQAAVMQRWPATTLVAGSPDTARLAAPWGALPESLAMMQVLKRRFDPRGVLQPGRYLSGI